MGGYRRGMNAHVPAAASALVDPFGRAITYVRVSVTDRCDFRCVYCMSEDMTFLSKPEVLSLEELDRLCSAFVRMGTRKLRVTGGEPPPTARNSPASPANWPIAACGGSTSRSTRSIRPNSAP